MYDRASCQSRAMIKRFLTNSTKLKIQNLISSDVCLFMKGTLDQPLCGFSQSAVTMLKHLEIPFTAVNVLDDLDLREGIKEYSNWPTIPQLYIKGEFVGGADIMLNLAKSGDLKRMAE